MLLDTISRSVCGDGGEMPRLAPGSRPRPVFLAASEKRLIPSPAVDLGIQIAFLARSLFSHTKIVRSLCADESHIGHGQGNMRRMARRHRW